MKRGRLAGPLLARQKRYSDDTSRQVNKQLPGATTSGSSRSFATPVPRFHRRRGRWAATSPYAIFSYLADAPIGDTPNMAHHWIS